jgi:hypothetical protein
MQGIDALIAYMAPQPYLPLASLVAIMVGLLLTSCRVALSFVARRARRSRP